MRHLFISDLHLDSGRPHHVQALRDFCDNKLDSSSHLYILGDLFEAWLGDDMGLVAYADVVNLLTQLTKQGTKVFIQHGNRDFLLGKEFVAATGAILLGEEAVIEINQTRVLLMHVYAPMILTIKTLKNRYVINSGNKIS